MCFRIIISALFMLCVFLFLTVDIYGQNQPTYLDTLEMLQREYDRAKSVYRKEKYEPVLEILDSLVNVIPVHEVYDPIKADILLFRGRCKIASFSGRDKATLDLLEALSFYEKAKNKEGISECYMHLGVVNYDIENYGSAISNFQKIWELGLDSAKTTFLSYYLSAICFSELGEFERAKNLFDKAEAGFGFKDTVNLIQINTFRAKMYSNLGEPDKAISLLNELITKYPQSGLKDFFVPIHTFLSTAYLQKHDPDQVIQNASEAFGQSINKALYSIYIREAAKNLHQAYFEKKMYDSAYHYLDMLKNFRDSLTDIQSLIKITELNEKYEFERQLLLKKAEQDVKDALATRQLEFQKFTRNLSISGFLIALIIALFILIQRIKLAREKKKSDKLLLNILPADIADELKQKGYSEARQHEKVCILFTDFKDFTPASAKLTASELVSEVNYFFEAFDKICKTHGIEKIKTIGDAYMAVGGLPKPSDDSVKHTVLAGLEMQEFVKKRSEGESSQINFEMRVGIHCGPVVAGIVGLNKFQYDIWGDTVNTASRLESCGEVGKVNISKSIYAEICADPEFSFEPRGQIQVKGKGEIEMYFVEKAITSSEIEHKAED